MLRTRVVILAEDAGFRRMAEAHLRCEAYEVEAAHGIPEVLSRVQAAPLPDVVVLDIQTAGAGAPQLIAQLRQARPLVKIVVAASRNDLGHVVEAVRSGADACVWKETDATNLDAAIRGCAAGCPEAPFHEESPGDVEHSHDGSFFVAASPAMRKLRAQIDQVARIDVPVLCLGESGTGKEVATRWLHKLSARSHRTFLKVNCAAVPAELLESELFGYERGAFTGAVRSKPGKFELCNHGTLLLDEIGEMPPALQAKLLHVLQDQEYARLGGCGRVRVDVRVVATTNIDIHEAIARKEFREDLYYRLGVFVFDIPPLRERREDIPILLRRYTALHALRLGLPERAISNELWKQCLRYEWPGNVRELENFAKRYLIFGEEALNLAGANGAPDHGIRGDAGPVPARDLKSHMRELYNGAEASAIAQALEQTRWNRKQAAHVLNISYKSLLSKIRQHGLDQPDGKTETGQYDLSCPALD